MFEAADGEEAISVLKATPVDVVITDLRMRVVGDGMEFAHHVRAHCPGVSLVLASAKVPRLTEHLTFDAFFIKPYPPEDLVAWIRRRHISTSDHADRGLA